MRVLLCRGRHVAINKQCIALPNKKSGLTFDNVDSVDSSVKLNLVLVYYSLMTSFVCV